MSTYRSVAQRYITRGSNALDRLRTQGEPNRVLRYDPAATVLARECLWSILDAAEYVHRALRARQCDAMSHEEILRAITRISDSMPRDPQAWHAYGPGTQRGHVLVHKHNSLSDRKGRRAPIHAEPFLEARLLALAECVGLD